MTEAPDRLSEIKNKYLGTYLFKEGRNEDLIFLLLETDRLIVELNRVGSDLMEMIEIKNKKQLEVERLHAELHKRAEWIGIQDSEYSKLSDKLAASDKRVKELEKALKGCCTCLKPWNVTSGCYVCYILYGGSKKPIDETNDKV